MGAIGIHSYFINVHNYSYYFIYNLTHILIHVLIFIIICDLCPCKTVSLNSTNSIFLTSDLHCSVL